MRTVLTSLVLVPALAVSGVAASAGAGDYKPTWESLSKVTPAPEWFRDAGFGIYFHWGVYSIQLLGSDAKIEWTRTDEGLTLRAPQEELCDDAVVFRIAPRKSPAF